MLRCVNSFSTADSTPPNSHPDSLLSHPSHEHDLPPQILEDLRGMGRVQAPEELWDRVQAQVGLESLPQVEAPEELWQRVQGELQREPAAKVLQGSFLSRRWAAAAAVLVLGGLAFFLPGTQDSGAGLEGPVLASHTPEALRAEFRAKAMFVTSKPSEMSPIARSLAESLGSLMVEDDA